MKQGKPIIHRMPESEWFPVGAVSKHARTFFYVIQEEGGGPVKVGVTGHPTRRLSRLQCGNYRVLRLRYVATSVTPGSAAAVERLALAQFADRVRLGEWLDVGASELLPFLLEFEQQ